jgi:hypothetical protein
MMLNIAIMMRYDAYPLFKMAEMNCNLLDNKNDSGSKEFKSTATVVQVICMYC